MKYKTVSGVCKAKTLHVVFGVGGTHTWLTYLNHQLFGITGFYYIIFKKLILVFQTITAFICLATHNKPVDAHKAFD